MHLPERLSICAKNLVKTEEALSALKQPTWGGGRSTIVRTFGRSGDLGSDWDGRWNNA